MWFLVTSFGCGQEEWRSYDLCKAETLVWEREREESRRIRKEKEEAEQEAELAKFGDMERPGQDEINRRQKFWDGDISEKDLPIPGPDEIERRIRIIQSIVETPRRLLKYREPGGTRKHLVTDWDVFLTWRDIHRAKSKCSKSNPMQWITDLIELDNFH